jgi:hypothetical protein
VSSNYQHWGTRADGTAEPFDTSAVSVVANTTMPYPETGGNATVAPYGWASMHPQERNQVMCRMQSRPHRTAPHRTCQRALPPLPRHPGQPGSCRCRFQLVAVVV